jgi:hypothetical protein
MAIQKGSLLKNNYPLADQGYLIEIITSLITVRDNSVLSFLSLFDYKVNIFIEIKHLFKCFY